MDALQRLAFQFEVDELVLSPRDFYPVTSNSEEVPFLYRLFVGWVPKEYTEQDLTPLFNQYGVVKDIILLKDKQTKQTKGCAFVSYATKAEAQLAIQQLDRQVQLPGAQSPLEVRFAKSHQYVQAGAGPEDNRQLFFSAAPTELNEPELSTFFSQFGVIEEINLFRERKSQKSKGCGFVTFQTRAQAVSAMATLEHKGAEPSKDMTVQWADPELQLKKKKALEDSNADNRMLFFAKVLRSGSEEEVKRLFSKYGKVYDVNLFRAFQGAPTTKGCGLVTMGTHEEACAAIEGLDNQYTWEGLDSPMVVKWMDAALQRRRREQHLAAMREGLKANMGPAGFDHGDAWLPQPLALGGMHAMTRPGLSPAPAMILQDELGETPPAGCTPDAIKLFVGNIPKLCTEEQLLPFFETVGKVAELVIVRDKVNHQSKGSAFVWYTTRAHAERAILQFNLRHVLPDPAGEQDRPLVVRKARARVSKVLPKALTPMGSHHPSVAMLTQSQPMISLTHQPTGFYTTTHSKIGNSINLGGGIETLSSMQPAPGTNYVHMAGAAGGLQMSSGYRTMQQMPSAQLVSIQAAPTVSDTGLYEAYGGGHAGGEMDRYMLSAPQMTSSDSMAPMALSLPLNMQQLALVNNHLFSVQSMSGAQLNISPGAPGLFHLLISGSKVQVENARNLVSSVLGQAIMADEC